MVEQQIYFGAFALMHLIAIALLTKMLINGWRFAVINILD
jgi:hypothetical protein